MKNGQQNAHFVNPTRFPFLKPESAASRWVMEVSSRYGKTAGLMESLIRRFLLVGLVHFTTAEK